MLRLRTFGGLRLDRDTSPVAGPAARPRPLAILAVIAAAGSRGITRDRLMGILWPESAEEQARHVLSQSLYALRRDLGHDDLILNGGALRLNPAVITSDVAEFIEAFEAAALERAIEVYRGPFVDGFYLSGSSGFERWAEEERSRLAAQYARAVEAAASVAESSGDNLGAAELWSRATAADPLATRPVARRARALAAAGEPAAALKLLRDHAALLAHEGIASPPELATVERDIRSVASTGKPVEAAIAVARAQPAQRLQTVEVGLVRGSRGTRVAALLLVAAVGAVTFAAIRNKRATPPVLAVGLMESHLQSDSLGLARSLPDLITTQLAQVPGLAVVSRGRLLEVLGGHTASGPGALARGARAAGAGEIVEGAIYDERGGLRLDLRRVNLSNGRTVAAVAVEAPDASQLVERAAVALAASLRLDAPTARLADVTSVSLVARRLYEEGLRSFYAGDHRAASRLFEAALADDSTFAMAAYYFARSEDGVDAESTAARWKRASTLAHRATDRERLLILSGGAFALNDARLIAYAESVGLRYPNDLDGRFLMGELRLTEGDFDGAYSVFLGLAHSDSAGRRPGAMRCRACEAMNSAVWASLMGDSLARAERLARELVRWNPEHPDGYGMLWTVLLRRGDYAGAMAALERQNELAPRSASPREMQMVIALRRGDFRALDSLTRTVLETQEELGQLHYALGWRATYLRETGQAARAAVLGRRARLTADTLFRGRSPNPFHTLPEALAYLQLGRQDPEAAQTAARLFDSMATMPTYPEPRMARHRVWMWTHEATARALAGDTSTLPGLETRIIEMSRYSSYGRDRLMARYVRGLLLESRGDLAGAARAYQSAIWSPTENHIAARLAGVLLRLARPADAVRVLQPWLRGPIDAANQYIPRFEVHALLAEAFTALGVADSAEYHRAWGRVERRKDGTAERR